LQQKTTILAQTQTVSGGQKSIETTTQSFTECTHEALDTCLHAIGIFFLLHKSIWCHKSWHM